MSKSLITSPSPQTFIEACDSLRDLQAKVNGTLDEIRKRGKDLIEYRYLQGKVAGTALGMDRKDHYGDEVMKTLAQRSGVHERTLYRCLQFYRQIDGGLNHLRKWMDDKEEEKGSISWNYCINWSQKALPEEEKDAEEKLEKEIKKLDKKAEKLEHEAIDLEKRAIEWNDEDKQDEALGAAMKAREVAEDVRRQAERLKLQKPERIRDEDYLQFVRGFDCLVCSQKGEPHHLITGGMSTKGPDWVTVPLCRAHHTEYHDINHGPFCHRHDIDLWRAVANLVTLYFTGVQIDKVL